MRFAQPILDLISEATSWKTTLLAGGPEPAHEGRLNVSLKSFLSLLDVPYTFIAFTQELQVVILR